MSADERIFLTQGDHPTNGSSHVFPADGNRRICAGERVFD